MSTRLILLSVVLLQISGALGRDCRDCMVYTSCPSAKERVEKYQNQDTLNLFESANCGYEDTRPKVCCSSFPKLETRFGDSGREAKEKLLPKNCGRIYGDRIVGGTQAKLYELPWMTLISYVTRDGQRFECGGSIINSRYILTAAHCVVGKKIAGVRVGEYNYLTDVDSSDNPLENTCEEWIQDIYVEEEIPHENYQQLTQGVLNDIALLRVQDEIEFNHPNVKPICLPLSVDLQKKNIVGKNGTVAGWGVTETDMGSPVLLKVDVPVHGKLKCEGFYNRNTAGYRVTNQFCAGELNKDSCGGDSGGPFMVQQSYRGKDSLVQYGIVSFGPRKCGSTFPGVYTDVTKYVDWILDKIRE
ncbi:unnamed protein product [Leptosia nina]|uniref:CLIP domain-containing serine protease n=1 Tax=Leptosia nina TaxID=320188 RepID=A0AAV1JV36_9NEOP